MLFHLFHLTNHYYRNRKKKHNKKGKKPQPTKDQSGKQPQKQDQKESDQESDEEAKARRKLKEEEEKKQQKKEQKKKERKEKRKMQKQQEKEQDKKPGKKQGKNKQTNNESEGEQSEGEDENSDEGEDSAEEETKESKETKQQKAGKKHKEGKEPTAEGEGDSDKGEGDNEEEDKKEGEDDVDEDLEMVHVEYCEFCTVPHEFCSFFSQDLEACKSALKRDNSKLYGVIYEGRKEEVDQEAKKNKKNKNIKQPEKVTADTEVRVLKQKRGGKKMVTTVHGIGNSGINLKEFSKKLGKKFACGNAIVIDEESGEQIVQLLGDIDEGDLMKTIESDFPELMKAKFNFVEGGNKKGRKKK